MNLFFDALVAITGLRFSFLQFESDLEIANHHLECYDGEAIGDYFQTHSHWG